nr:type II secretion system minor pseudopilin GspJ [uncultured Sphingosinicella sp.]
MRSAGFTLVELLVALTIFSLLSAAGVTLLSFSVRAQDAADERLTRLAEIRRAGALLTSDLAQAAPRVSRDEAGAPRAAMIGESGQGSPVVLSLVRRGWENLDGAARPSLQKVEYRWVGGQLERIAYRFVDGSPAMPSVAVVTGVRALRLRYRGPRGEWRDRWDPTQPMLLPTAVEMVMATEESGSIRQLFLVGTVI